MCLWDRPYLSPVCDTGPATGLCLCKAGCSQGLGDTHGRGVLVPSGTPAVVQSPAEQCPHRGTGLAGMLLPAAIGSVGWFLQGGEKHLQVLPGGARPKGQGSRWAVTAGEVLAAPSRAAVSAPTGSSVQGLAPGSCLGKGDMDPKTGHPLHHPPCPGVSPPAAQDSAVTTCYCAFCSPAGSIPKV